MPKSSPKPRRFSHVELIDAIDLVIKRLGLDLSPPSLPTVKSWSAKGLLDYEDTAHNQAQVAVARMRSRPAYYNTGDRGRKKVVQAGVETVAQAPTSPVSTPQLQQVLGQLARLQASLDSLITDIAKANAPRPAAAGDVEGLVRSVDQLNAVRQHLMRRHDAELLLMKQQSGAQGGPASATGLADQVRMEGRMNRFEANQARMLELLQNLQSRS